MEYKKSKKVSDGAKKKDANPVLKKHVGLIHCENKLTFLQRKICNIFLFNALNGIEKENIHQIPLKKLCSLIGYKSNDIDLIKKAIKSLISTVMEWNLLEDSKFVNEENFSSDVISWNASSLLAGASIERGLVSYSYSPQIRTVLLSLEIYGRINLFVQSKFNSGYSLALYENCVRFKNIGKTPWFKLELFRALMGIMNGQYESFKELKRNVITVAVNEINQKADIYIEPEYQKVGKLVSSIKFLIAENEYYQPIFKKTNKINEQDNLQYQNNLSLLKTLVSEFEISEKQAKEIIFKYEEQYIFEKINLVKKNKNVDIPSAYLMSALKNDYRESKKIKSNVERVGGVQSTYLREPEEASRIRSLKNKYREYQLKAYMKFLSEKSILEKVQEEFMQFIRQKNPMLAPLYQKRDLQSPMTMIEFINYVDQHYSNGPIKILNFEEFITEEESVLTS